LNGRRVVVTGLGMVTPLGNDVPSTWQGLIEARSGINLIEHFDTSAFTTRFGGSIKNFDCEPYMPSKDAKRMDVFLQYGMAAGVQAMRDAGLDGSSENTLFNPLRFGAAIGSGIGGISAIETTSELIRNSGPRKVSPFFVPGSIINMIGGTLSIRYNLQGPNIAITTACTTGTHNIGFAAQLIASGQADLMLAGGAEMATSPVGLGGFCAARALSTRNEDPQSASRPWDKSRDGFVLSDGAGIMVLEEYEHAKRRGARIYAELAGFGMSADAFHMTSPSENGRGAAVCMQNALASAEMNPGDIGYINAHGTSTIAGDVAETQAIKTVFKEHAYTLAVSSSKSMLGHLLGAAGAVEAIISVLSLHHQLLTPTINLEEADAECDLDYVPNQTRDTQMRAVLSNSFGFGGTNGSLIFSKAD
jgi:3-oxoacyl-[acyl-carrier-protein] synthase II